MIAGLLRGSLFKNVLGQDFLIIFTYFMQSFSIPCMFYRPDSSAMHSQWSVWGNMSTGCTVSAVKPLLSR